MERQPGRPSNWKEWGALAWGNALFQHYFIGTDSKPVSRLAIGPEELARAASATDDDAPDARDSFLAAIRCPAARFREHLSAASLEPSVWNRREPPPFLPYLFFTCFAAASLDPDTADIGQFRQRVRQLLRHAPGTTYAFRDLSKLWLAFSLWLQERHNAGQPYRVLTLPDPGHMTLIGFSVRLAFPWRDDRVKLRQVLLTAGAVPISTVPEALQAISGGRNRFSADFRHVFDRAREAFVHGRRTSDLEALWSAILEVAALPVPDSRRASRIRYQLFAQEDELGRIDPFIAASGVPSRPIAQMRFSRLVEPFDVFDHLVTDADGNPTSVTKSLLTIRSHDRIPGLAASPLVRAVKEGVLLLKRLDSAIWELTLTRPSDGKICALVRHDLSARFLRLLVIARRDARESRIAGWDEISEFDVTQLAVPRLSDLTGLARIRCLQPVEVGPHLHLISPIRVDGGVLGIRSVLPEVHCADAESGAVFRLSESDGELHSKLFADLQPDPQNAHVFRWPVLDDDLDGPFIVAGTRNGGVVASREVVFHSRGLSSNYLGPTDPTRWFVETSRSDVSAAVSALDLYLAMDTSSGAQQMGHSRADIASVIPDFSVDAEASHDRLTEVLAAISVARKGISEGELFELFTRLLSGSKEFGVWEILRGWVEAGYFDCLTRRHWRGRVYFARRPQLVVVPQHEDRSVRIVLHGLLPYRLRTKAREVLSRVGAESPRAMSLSRFVPAPLSWFVGSFSDAEAIAAELGGLKLTTLRAVGELIGDFNSAVSDQERLPAGYELQRIWNWQTGRFGAPVRTPSEEVRIEYYSRLDGPDRYVVSVGERRFATLSRTWALLAGFRHAARTSFMSSDSVLIVRQGNDGPQVPVPVSRALALRAGVVGGPADDGRFGRCYLYAATTPGEARQVLGWLNGRTSAEESVTRRFAWLRAAAMASAGDKIAVPADLRHRLRALTIPDAVAIAGRPVPRRLLALVRHAVKLAET